MPGPLSGLKIIEMAGIGPAPFCGMMLADHGAEVIRVDRPTAARNDVSRDILQRSRRSIVVDLKTADGRQVVRDLCKGADGLIEGFRPGVMERLGLSPVALLPENPKLVYGRMTGWGQSGRLSHAAGHDINYISISGNLHTYGRADAKPTPPLNAVGDFGGGGMMLAFGMVSAILAARISGSGQIIDCSMVDGSAVLAAFTWAQAAMGERRDERGVNMLDTGAHFYETYETLDGKWISIGSIEPQFYRELRRLAQIEADPDFDAHMDQSAWPRLKEKLARVFKTRTRDEWCSIMEGTDACFAPVLSMTEAPDHRHNEERRTFIDVGGVTQPAPAPRYSRTLTDVPRMPTQAGADADQVLASIGYTPKRIAELRTRGVIG